MIQTEDFIKRLEYLMEHYELNASLFADKIGVQRSGISHLLSGRNKPSLDFVMKISEEFPEVNLYWLLKGSGSFLAADKIESENPMAMAPEKKLPAVVTTSESPEIDKVIVLHKDGSFSDYKPRP